MTTYRKDWDDIKTAYAPQRISEYVEKNLERMYFGKAPTLRAINDDYGQERYEALMAMLINEIFKFAGAKESFSEDVMNTVAQTIRAEYPWLKITEMMHFVYLFRLGTYDKFYGKPSGAALMQMLRQYVKGDRERLRAEFLAKQEKERRILETAYRVTSYNAALINSEIAKAFSEEERAKQAWRYQPWGTAMARAYFVDGSLRKYPGDMDDAEQYRWAKDNESYVKMFPNLNTTIAKEAI